MPDLDGYQLLKQVRQLGEQRGGGLPAIALTAFAGPDDRTRALDAGFRLHVAKPVDLEELVRAVAVELQADLGERSLNALST